MAASEINVLSLSALKITRTHSPSLFSSCRPSRNNFFDTTSQFRSQSLKQSSLCDYEKVSLPVVKMLSRLSACRLPAAASAGYQGGFGEYLGVEICVTTDEPINQLTADYPVCAVTHTFRWTCALWRTRAHLHLCRRNWSYGPFLWGRMAACTRPCDTPLFYSLERRLHSSVKLIDPANGIFSHLFATSHG